MVRITFPPPKFCHHGYDLRFIHENLDTLAWIKVRCNDEMKDKGLGKSGVDVMWMPRVDGLFVPGRAGLTT